MSEAAFFTSSRLLPVLLAAIAACDGCSRVPEVSPSTPVAPLPHGAVEVTPAVLGRSPHDPRAFTQGLVFADGVFLESTGEYGESSLRRVDPATGRVLQSIRLAPDVFGEGLARLHGELFQLTWQEHRCFVYDEHTFERRREMPYDGEGWGLTTDGDGLLVMSDGSAVLRFREPASFHVTRTLPVHDGARPVEKLNELEWVRGELLANVWGSSFIVRIDPRSGDVLGHLDLAGLPESHHDDPNAVLNGIAYDEGGDRLFVTGKRWESVFEVARPGR